MKQELTVKKFPICFSMPENYKMFNWYNFLINRYKFDHFAMLLTRVLAISATDDQRHQEVEFEKDFHD